ncbi:MAG: methyltransferase domain-containing protein [Proteobacteria bacterium]|nr:methyltransferase domain-containing protein [Pseudomonadota bacterium]
MSETTAGFGGRIVDYEFVHGNQEEDFKNLLKALHVWENDVVLDGCAGYMNVSERILAQFVGKKPTIYALEQSPTQIQRAKEKNLVPEDRIVQGDIAQMPFQDNMFDRVVVKMGMHEMPIVKQKEAFKECYRVLKPNGKMVIWDLFLPDDETQRIFSDIIRKKDTLAGFEAMVQNRYFQKHTEIIELFQQAGFLQITKEFKVDSHLSMERRLSELVSKDRQDVILAKGKLSDEDERRLDDVAQKRLVILCDYIRNRIPSELREKFQFKDSGSNIEIVVDKAIVSGIKKSR